RVDFLNQLGIKNRLLLFNSPEQNIPNFLFCGVPLRLCKCELRHSYFLVLFVDLEDGEEGFLRYLDLADALHALLALLLLFEELALARDVAAVALGDDVLPQSLDGLAGDDLVADGGLDRNLEELARDELAHPLGEEASARLRVLAVDDDGEGVNRLAR